MVFGPIIAASARRKQAVGGDPWKFETGTWTNPAAGQTVNLRDSALDIAFLFTRRLDASTPAYYKHQGHVGTACDRFNNNYNPSSGGINTIGTGTFNVGNQLGAGPIQYFAFSAGDGIEFGTYAGTGSGGFTVSGLPFRPLSVWLLPSASLFDAMMLDGSPFGDQYFTGGNPPGTLLVSINADGFTSGDTGDTAGFTFHWMALGAVAGVVGEAQYTGNGTGQPVAVAAGGATPTLAFTSSRQDPGMFPMFRARQGAFGSSTNGSVMLPSQSGEAINGVLSMAPDTVTVGGSNFVSNLSNPFSLIWCVKP